MSIIGWIITACFIYLLYENLFIGSVNGFLIIIIMTLFILLMVNWIYEGEQNGML